MFKNLSLVFVGTQIAPYVNPYIAKFVFVPLLTKLREMEAQSAIRH